MKVFFLNDYEYWAGPDLESCIQAAMKQWGVSREEAVDGAYEVPDDSMDKMRVCIDENEDPNGPTITFREFLVEEIARGAEFPCFFCGME